MIENKGKVSVKFNFTLSRFWGVKNGFWCENGVKMNMQRKQWVMAPIHTNSHLFTPISQ